MASKPQIIWPKNLVVQGQLAFPLRSEADIIALAEWREKKGHAPSQYADKIGAHLILNRVNYDKAKKYLVETYLPFVDALYKDTNGAKGIEPDLVEALLEQAKSGTWEDPLDRKHRPNMPLRNLSDKDRENMRDFPGVAKISFMGPYEADIDVRAIVTTDGERVVTTIEDVVDRGLLPEGNADTSRLWWGSGWPFRTSLRFHAYDKASVGISAYTAGTLYLLADNELPTFGRSSEAADVIEDGDDADWD